MKVTSTIALFLLLGCTGTDSAVQLTLDHERKGKGPVVVLFDGGAPSGMSAWDPIWDRLPGGITAIRYSRRGEGNSPSCDRQLTLDDYVDDLEHLLEQLGIEQPFIYVSHSFGGSVSLAFAAKNHGRLATMLLVDPSNPRDVDIVRQVNPDGGEAEIARIKASDYAAGRDKWCFLDTIWDKQPAPGYAEIGDIPITLIAGVKRVAKPTQTFETDEARRLWGVYQSEWVAQFPRGRALLTENSGHFVQDDEPELVLAELQRFIQSFGSAKL